MQELSALLERWQHFEPYRRFVEGVGHGQNGAASGLSSSLPGFLGAALIRDLDRPALFVTVGQRAALECQAELMEWLPEWQVLWLPPRPYLVGEVSAESRDWEHRRMGVFQAMASDRHLVVVADAEAIRQRVLPTPPRQSVSLELGTVLGPDAVARRLVELGYERETEARVPGQFSWRGGILDVISPGQQAVRIEWFDETVDSLRHYDPETQRSVANISTVTLGPSRETFWTHEMGVGAVRRIGEEAATQVTQLRARGERERAQAAEERWSRVLAAIEEGRALPGIERFSGAFGPLLPLSQLFATPPLVLFHDLSRIQEALAGQEQNELARDAARLEKGDLLPLETLGRIPAANLAEEVRGFATIQLALLPHGHSAPHVLALNGRPAPRAHGQADLLATEIGRLKKARLTVLLVARDADSVGLLSQHLMEQGVVAGRGLGSAGTVGIVEGHVGHGFVLPELALALLGETEFTGREVESRPAKKPKVPGGLVRLMDLTPGDFVVHATHGIGKFLGVVTLEVSGQHKDYLHIQYAGTDTLYVPVDQLGLVQKYVGVEGQSPKLSKMGGADWGRVKERIKGSVREMARELVKLYAQRETQPGYNFGPDTPWQADFEVAFPYEETQDQLRAVEEIKRDMESPRPMDRLLCGDVGYGKTEVALRAAFKAIMAGKQAAFLVPTTLLAEQHFATAKSRMSGFPIEIEALSRFRSAKEQAHILKRLREGRVDFVIGTHRLLSKDLRFHDLGLLIVDEEHRFGVAHKERIKALKANVDVLTLTATPIPRTLHMALVGIRDMSVIETPPEERLPVETVVMEYHDDAVREAIRHEVDRGGQVYYVQNRIRSMDAAVLHLQKLLPDVRIGVVHGQMEEDRIEEVMARFIEQEYDLLLATSIIESGLDIPNTNTLVVEDSDHFGLAQLYQLRGRVGRSSRLAYAYFTYRPNQTVTPQAERRLEAIREFTELGAGYQIALRDLEIRGAGNLLGAEQHGFIASVGLDLYTEMLRQEVAELRGQARTPEPVEPTLEMTIEAYLPESFVGEPRAKIDVYKRLAAARDLQTVDDIAEELEDRFGDLPIPACDLLDLARIRVLARDLGIGSVIERPDRVLFRGGGEGVTADGLRALAEHFPGRLVPGTKEVELGIRLKTRGEREPVIPVIKEALSIMKGVNIHATKRQNA